MEQVDDWPDSSFTTQSIRVVRSLNPLLKFRVWRVFPRRKTRQGGQTRNSTFNILFYPSIDFRDSIYALMLVIPPAMNEIRSKT